MERKRELNNVERSHTLQELEKFDKRQASGGSRFNAYDDSGSITYVDAHQSGNFSVKSRDKSVAPNLRTITQMHGNDGSRSTNLLPALPQEISNINLLGNLSVADGIRISDSNRQGPSHDIRSPRRETFGQKMRTG